MSANDNEGRPELTNDDIYNLYEIVQLAQTLPGPPFRALIKAYDQIRSSKNLSDDGSRYFTFLCHLRDANASADESLLDRFQRMLADMDIYVDIDPEGEGVEVTSNLDTTLAHEPPFSQTSTRGVKSRSGSHNSFFDRTAEKIPGSILEMDLPLRSRRGSQAQSDVENRLHKRRSRSSSRAMGGLLPIRSRVDGIMDPQGVPEQLSSQSRRKGSTSDPGSELGRRSGDADTQRSSDYDSDDSDLMDNFDRSHIRIPGVNAPIPDAPLDREYQYQIPLSPFRPSDTQVDHDADTLDYQRVFSVARKCLQDWRARALDHAQRVDEMNVTARAFDRNVLLRGSLDSWRDALQIKHQIMETDRFFGRLESRATKARSLFLLTKAFTHWAKSAEDEVQRTSVARRHILRTKYFNAWREITAVNELKIQQFTLSKFLNSWRNRTADVREQGDLAVELFKYNDMSKLFKGWYMKMCIHKAPKQDAVRLQSNVFQRWLQVIRTQKEKVLCITKRRDGDNMRTVLKRLQSKMEMIRSKEIQADDLRRSSLKYSAFCNLRKQAQLKPIEDFIRERRDHRILRSTLQIWCHDTRLNLQAREVDRMRTMRNSFTAWNDMLRVKELKFRIDDRLATETLYKWVLASRLSLFRRVRDHNHRKSVFTRWIGQTQNRETRLENAEVRFVDFKRGQILLSCLRKLEDTTVYRKNQEHFALSLYQPKLKSDTFAILTFKHRQLQELNEWADRAQYYITLKHAIQRWQKATEFARRRRRRELYTQFRRNIKMNLVRRYYGTWTNRTAQLRLQDRQADEIIENRIINMSSDLLEHWRDRASALHDYENDATRNLRFRIASNALSTWTQKSRALQRLSGQAIVLRQESTEIAASACLKKLNWRLFNMQRKEEDARALYERTFEKHVRAIIRFWREQARELLAQKSVSPTPSARVKDVRNEHDESVDVHDGGIVGNEESYMDDIGDETRGLEVWTAFDEKALGLSNLDLSLSKSPQRQRGSALKHRPATYLQPQSSAIRSPPLPKIPDLEDEEEEGAFWSSTPMPVAKPGYLKTPSRRSVVRNKRPGLPSSPPKRDAFYMGAASAPPVPGAGRIHGSGHEGVTSFERRLREGGYGRGRTRVERGKGRVAFGDLRGQ